jgi:hypothetical protein
MVGLFILIRTNEKSAAVVESPPASFSSFRQYLLRPRSDGGTIPRVGPQTCDLPKIPRPIQKQVIQSTMTKNPYASPTADDGGPPEGRGRRTTKIVGAAILAAGLICLVYGAVAFWLVQTLPPNGGPTGRLPSAYVMGVGMVIAILGLAIRDLRLVGGAKQRDGAPAKGIPTGVGLLLLAAMVIAMIIAISLS